MTSFYTWVNNPRQFGVPQWSDVFLNHCFYSPEPQEEEIIPDEYRVLFGIGESNFTILVKNQDLEPQNSNNAPIYTYQPFTLIEQYLLASVCVQPIIAIAHHSAPNLMAQSNTLHIDIQAGPSKITFWLTGYYNPEQQKMDLRFGVRMYPFTNPA